MSTPGTSSVPALVSAFAFGIVVNAAAAALFLNVSGQGSAVFRDGQRLVLATFLLSAALWALIDFISIAIDTTAITSCQIGIIFNTLFDQLARVSIEQHLLWAVNNGAKMGPQQVLPQVLLGIRFVFGGVFVGFSRPQFNPVCVPMSSMEPIAVTVVVLDAVMIAALAFCAFSSGLVAEVREGRSDSRRSKSILLVIVAFAAWTAMSVTMLLGIRNMQLLLQTLLPAVGLLLLIFVVTACNDALTAESGRAPMRPESPGVREISTGLSGTTENSTDYPPARFEDLKRSEVLSMTAFEQPRMAPKPDSATPPQPAATAFPNISNPVGGFRMDGTRVPPFPPVAATAAPAGLLFPPLRSNSEPAPASPKLDTRPRADSKGPKAKRSLFDLRGGPAANKMTISTPILRENGERNPLNKMPTISLEEAARMERERRTNNLQRESALIAKRPAPQPPSALNDEGSVRRTVSLKRKEVAAVGSSQLPPPPMPPMPPVLPQPPLPSAAAESLPIATTSSAQLSPAAAELRRRSPRQMPADVQSRYSSPTTVSGAAPPPIPSPAVPLPPPKQQQEQQRQEQQQLKPTQDISMLQPRAAPFPPGSKPGTVSVFPAVPVSSSASGRTVGSGPRSAAPTAGLPKPPIAVNIRPSRQLAQATPAPPAPDAPKTALQRRPTTGLPGNPRSMAVKAATKAADESAGNQRQQTIMFMNDIVYNDPEAVQTILDSASIMENEKRSSGSVVNRPRPIPRKPEKDRAIFPAEPSPNLANHRRSKSGGSIMNRKSVLQSNPGSPTQLPPLPPPPKNLPSLVERGNVNRPLPNDTKSMTFDEKMVLLFPSPPSADGMTRRRSSVPDLPQMVQDYMAMNLSPVSGFDDAFSRLSRSTNRSARTSVKTENIFNVDELPQIDAGRLPEPRPFSVADEVDKSWLPGISDAGMDLPVPAPKRGNSTRSARSIGNNSTKSSDKRASSPILPIMRQSTSTAVSDMRTGDDASTNWGSVHSPVMAVPISTNRQVVRPTYIKNERGAAVEAAVSSRTAPAELLPKRPPVPPMPPMPAMPPARPRRPSMAQLLPPAVPVSQAKQSPPTSSDEDDTDDGGAKKSSKPASQWYYRVGDNCPTFSDRKEKTRSRKMPPPAPLLLGPSSTRNPVIVKAAVPSPLESPEKTLAFIQAQLRKFEEPNMSTTESPGQRLALLENLEKEMDMQAGHWKEMQHDLGRDSMSSMLTLSPAVESRRQSLASNRGVVPIANEAAGDSMRLVADRRAARRSRIRSSSSLSRPPTVAPAAEAAAEEAGATTRDGGRLKRVIGLPSISRQKQGSMAILNMSDLGSPTPPDSEGSESEMELRRPQRPRNLEASVASVFVKGLSKTKMVHAHRLLWSPALTEVVTTPPTAMLWTASVSLKTPHRSVFAKPADRVPTTTRRTVPSSQMTSLANEHTIDASSLWTSKKANSTRTAGTGISGLWQPQHAEKRGHQMADKEQLQAHPQQVWLQSRPEALAALESQAGQEEPLVARVAPLPYAQMDEMMLDELELDYDEIEPSNFQVTMMSGSSNKAPRPLTQRPPRRSRRVTMLPDILESPEPMPDKRGTLGIFQFPWGELSDTVSVMPSNTTLLAMPGTMTTGSQPINAALEARSKQLEASEYSSSFFDDYDEEDELDYEDQDSDDDETASDSDDGFDENTLWEIASLLKTEKVPSKLSLLPPPLPAPTGSVMSDYMAAMSPGLELEEQKEAAEDNSNAVRALAISKLWTSAAHHSGGRHPQLSVAQPDAETWHKYYDNIASTLATAKRTATSVVAVADSAIVTTQLWTLQAPTEPWSSSGSAQLWTANEAKALQAKTTTTATATALLWTPLTKPTLHKTLSTGKKALLFDKETAAAAKLSTAVIRTTDAKPVAINMPRTAKTVNRVQRAQPDKLTSTTLWRLPATSSSLGKPQLWVAPKQMIIPSITGHRHLLFRVDVAAMEKMAAPVRTSNKEPVGVEGSRVAPRALVHLPEPSLTSTQLWTVAKAGQKERNWIAGNASAPAVAEVEVAETILSSSVGTKQPTWWEKMKAITGISTAEAASKSAASAASDETEAAARRSAASPEPKTKMQMHQAPLAASEMDWAAALHEALEASYAPVQLRRTEVATPDQWRAALDAAMARSYTFDAARKHPVTAGSWTSFVWANGAAAMHDAAKLHPVFFVGRVGAALEEQEQQEEQEEQKEGQKEQGQEEQQGWVPNAAILAQIEALEQERQFAEAMATRQLQQQQQQKYFAMPAVPVAPEVTELAGTSSSSAPSFPEATASVEDDASYHAHIMAMENEAMARLQALEGGSGGVVLRF